MCAYAHCNYKLHECIDASTCQASEQNKKNVLAYVCLCSLQLQAALMYQCINVSGKRANKKNALAYVCLYLLQSQAALMHRCVNVSGKRSNKKKSICVPMLIAITSRNNASMHQLVRRASKTKKTKIHWHMCAYAHCNYKLH